MPRFKIIVEYLGTGKIGWQSQSNGLSVQQIIEEAIETFTQEKVNIFAAGRTDGGVHAYGQVVHFDLVKNIAPAKVMEALNFFMRHRSVGILDCCEVGLDFHARFSATARHYVYKIINRRGPVILENHRAWWVKKSLNIELMKEAAVKLEGLHDFTSFRASACQSKSAIKHLTKIEITQAADSIKLYFSAPSFLHHMVRNIVGTLVDVGHGKYPPDNMDIILEKQHRNYAGPTAPAHGLYFTHVDY